MAWAPFEKSPNWASQRTNDLGSSMEYPYSNPITANSESGELTTLKITWKNYFFFWNTWNLPWVFPGWLGRLASGTYFLSVSWSTNSACLWEKVPRPLSCPHSLIEYPTKSYDTRKNLPSWSKLPKLMASAVAQSSLSCWIESDRAFANIFFNREWIF